MNKINDNKLVREPVSPVALVVFLVGNGYQALFETSAAEMGKTNLFLALFALAELGLYFFGRIK